jgi:hypothetical protein
VEPADQHGAAGVRQRGDGDGRPDADGAARIVDGLARAYGWPRRQILYDTRYADALTLLGLIREHEQDERRFLAGVHGVELTAPGSAAAQGGIKAFNERLKRRLTGR